MSENGSHDVHRPGLDCDRPQALADVGPIPEGEAVIEIPEDVLKMYARRYEEER